MQTCTCLSRRKLLQESAAGFGYLALASLLAEQAAANEPAKNAARPADPLAAKSPHFAPRAKRVIFLFMKGGPSHVDTFDYKPALDKMQGKSLPDSYRKGRQQLPGMSGA